MDSGMGGLPSLITKPVPDFLSFLELQHLAVDSVQTPELTEKLKHLLSTPIEYSFPESFKPVGSPLDSSFLGPFIRVASWNIERGFELDSIKGIFKPKSSREEAPEQSEMEGINEERQWLAASHVLLLTEVDMGMKRTGYEDVTAELARTLGMNAVFAPEFIELAPVRPDVVKLSQKPLPKTMTFGEDIFVDPLRYKGLHGSAIFSRYPIKNPRILRLPRCYDWYMHERENISILEKTVRVLADKIFLETILTELRYGDRIALVAEIEVPDADNSDHQITVVATHLENRGPASCRLKQFRTILDHVSSVQHPVIIGGDWNTSGGDVSPTSFKKEIMIRVKDPSFWSKQAISIAVPYGYALKAGLDISQYFHNLRDPSVHGLPLLAPNKEEAFFNTLRNFTFDDGFSFDLRGDSKRSYGNKSGFMSNSNERWLKGFQATFSLNRTLLHGLIGRYKLDWMLVKAYAAKGADQQQPYKMAPHFARTLLKVNQTLEKRISDHAPMTVDLPLKEPGNANAI
ncbi:MAG: hypothetical protein K2X01_03480 [Cyanobacteria bacterium]|nr:hypothetical protein [Cyanobacteriota bacterium]